MQKLSYTALEPISVPRPLDRLQCIEARAHGKLVFDLGALDETALESKRGNGKWLHARLCAVAGQVVGIDNSPLSSCRRNGNGRQWTNHQRGHL